MVTRIVSVILFLVAVAGTANAAPSITLQSQRRNVVVSVKPPSGWQGPKHHVWPSYDTFTFTDHHKPVSCEMEVRFDSYTDEPGDRHSPEDIVIHWNSTPIENMRAQLQREYSRPRVQRIATISAAGERVRVYAVYDAPDYN